jgi:hypothetical protein
MVANGSDIGVDSPISPAKLGSKILPEVHAGITPRGSQVRPVTTITANRCTMCCDAELE